jgi:hypothetical protein
MNIWHELAHNQDHTDSYKNMLSPQSNESQYLYIPLQFWFCRNAGLALPLIALQYHDVSVSVKFYDRTNVKINKDVPENNFLDFGDVKLLTEYVYLDSEERKRFAQASHEYLIEQVQDTGAENINNGSGNNILLPFNHPCKYLAWAVTVNDNDFGQYYKSGTETTTNPVTNAQLKLNGHDRFAKRDGDYFNYVLPTRHFNNAPAVGKT